MATLARIWVSLRAQALVLRFYDYCPGRAPSFDFVRLTGTHPSAKISGIGRSAVMNCRSRSILTMVTRPILAWMQGYLFSRWALAAVLAGVLPLVGCSDGTTSHAHTTPNAGASESFPSYSEAAARLKPCDSVSTAELSSIIGKPVHIDKIGNIGQRPFLSAGPVLPKVWIATCSWIIPAYPTTSLYLQMELAPSPAGARTDFDGMRSKMGITQSVVRAAGYGDAAVFNTDTHGGVVIIIRQRAEIINLQFNSTSQPAPAMTGRLKTAKSIARLIMQGQ